MTKTTSFKAYRNRWLWIAGCVEMFIYFSFGRVADVVEGPYGERPEWVNWLRQTIGEPIVWYWIICFVSILALRFVMVYKIVAKSPKRVRYGVKYGWLSMQLGFTMIGILFMCMTSGQRDLSELYWLFILVMVPLYAIINLFTAIVGAFRHRLKTQSEILDMVAE